VYFVVAWQGRTQDFILTEAKTGLYPEFQKMRRRPVMAQVSRRRVSIEGGEWGGGIPLPSSAD